MADRREEEERRKKRREEERRKQLMRSREQQRQSLLQRNRMHQLYERERRRRKKDCMIGMPFIIAFQGDPTRLYYCNDLPDHYELIPRTPNYHGSTPFMRLLTYQLNHVVTMNGKVLIYKAA
jgi:hypothetical protein